MLCSCWDFLLFLHSLEHSRFLILTIKALLIYVTICIMYVTSLILVSNALLSFCKNSFFICSYNDSIVFVFWLLSTRAYTRKKGRNNVTVDDLVHVITPKGRGRFFFFFSPFTPKCWRFLAFFIPHNGPLCLSFLTRWEHLQLSIVTYMVISQST